MHVDCHYAWKAFGPVGSCPAVGILFLFISGTEVRQLLDINAHIQASKARQQDQGKAHPSTMLLGGKQENVVHIKAFWIERMVPALHNTLCSF